MGKCIICFLALVHCKFVVEFRMLDLGIFVELYVFFRLCCDDVMIRNGAVVLFLS